MTQPIQPSQPSQPPTQTATLPSGEGDFERLLKGEHRVDGAFQSPEQFAHAQRISKLLVKSPMLPEHFRGDDKVPSMVIAVDIALRLRMNPMLVASQLYMVHGKPGWSAQFVIAAINISGLFSRITFEYSGEGDDRGCLAKAKVLDTGQELIGTKVTIGLAKKEGWFGKTGSKWQTMPEQMLAYRSAAFWSRLYAPELTMGLQTTEELEDVGGQEAPLSKPMFTSTNTKAEAIAEMQQLSKELAGTPAPAEEVKPEATPTVPENPALVPKQGGLVPKQAPLVPKMDGPVPRIMGRLETHGMGEEPFMAYMFDLGLAERDQTTLEKLDPGALETIERKLDDFVARIRKLEAKK